MGDALDPAALTHRLAELAVEVGANVQCGQVVRVSADVVHAPLVRAIADAAYRRGASFVELDLSDELLVRSQVLHARGEVRAHVSRWREDGLRELAERGGARVMVSAPRAPGAFDDLDAARLTAARPPISRAWRDVEYRVNNTIVPGPHVEWARSVHPGVAPADALARLWRQVAVACRLDVPDPAGAWRARFTELGDRARVLTALALDAVRLRGPGTDLLVGLAPTARWEPPTNVNEAGIEHAWNLPSEEVYTVPDPARADGRLALTRPAIIGGRLVHDVVLTFRNGAVVDAAGTDGIDALRAHLDREPGNRRLGELALVDGDSAVARTGATFGQTLLDENAAGHVALGFGFPELVAPAHRDQVNRSGDHVDVTFGSDAVEIVGIDRSGVQHELLSAGRWRLAG